MVFIALLTTSCAAAFLLATAWMRRSPLLTPVIDAPSKPAQTLEF